jgi:hypothetical protein
LFLLEAGGVVAGEALTAVLLMAFLVGPVVAQRSSIAVVPDLRVRELPGKVLPVGLRRPVGVLLRPAAVRPASVKMVRRQVL